MVRKHDCETYITVTLNPWSPAPYISIQSLGIWLKLPPKNVFLSIARLMIKKQMVFWVTRENFCMVVAFSVTITQIDDASQYRRNLYHAK